jgi:hypothetical protein
MAEKKQLEFFLLRYVPDAVKEEFVNIGVVMIESGANGAGFADVRFTRDWRRVRCLDPQADVQVLASLEREIRNQIVEVRDRGTLMRRLEDSFSNLIQLSGAKGCLAENPEEEIELLARLYLKKRLVPQGESHEIESGTPRLSGRQGIRESMKKEFERAGVWKFLMRGVPVAPYTHPGDPFKFDFGYKVGGEIKLFHAVSMTANVDSAVMLAARYPKISSGMARVTGAAPLLTAVVEAQLDRARTEAGFALEMMEESQIRVASTAEMPEIAETARVELRV